MFLYADDSVTVTVSVTAFSLSTGYTAMPQDMLLWLGCVSGEDFVRIGLRGIRLFWESYLCFGALVE